MRSWTIVASTCARERADVDRRARQLRLQRLLDRRRHSTEGAGRPDGQRRRKVAGELRIRDVDGGRRRRAQAGGIRVPGEPDDLQVRALAPHVGREVLADGVLIGKVPLREHLVDDRHGRDHPPSRDP